MHSSRQSPPSVIRPFLRQGGYGLCIEPVVKDQQLCAYHAVTRRSKLCLLLLSGSPLTQVRLPPCRRRDGMNNERRQARRGGKGGSTTFVQRRAHVACCFRLALILDRTELFRHSTCFPVSDMKRNAMKLLSGSPHTTTVVSAKDLVAVTTYHDCCLRQRSCSRQHSSGIFATFASSWISLCGQEKIHQGQCQELEKSGGRRLLSFRGNCSSGILAPRAPRSLERSPDPRHSRGVC